MILKSEITPSGPHIVVSALVPNRATIPQKKPPLYVSIHLQLSEKIDRESLPAGALIKEGPLATVFGVSRAPVRKALRMLEQSGLINRANGQGYVVGMIEAKRTFTLQDLKSVFYDQPRSEVARLAAWEAIDDSISHDVTNCLPFGTYRINESIACTHFSVGRTVLREALGRLQDRGLIEKTSGSHWIAGPLTARDVHEAFEIRRLLEPEALEQSAAVISTGTLKEMREKVIAVAAELESSPPESVEDLEHDLHRVLLKNTRNRRLLEAIEKNQLPFIVAKIFRRNFGLKLDIIVMEEHIQILDQLINKSFEVARLMLAEHLQRAEKSTLAKLRVLSTLPKPTTAPYLINVH